MPKVGDKEFEYSAKGLKEAEAEAARSGKPVEVSQRYQVGGMVHPHRGKRKFRGGGLAKRGTHGKGSV